MDIKKEFAEFPRIAPCLLTIIVDYMGYGLVLPLVAVIFSEAVHPIFKEMVHPQLKNFYMGLGFALYPLMMFFGSAFLGDLSDRWGRKKVMLLALIGMFISFALMAAGIKFHFLLFFLLGRAFSGLFAGSQPLAQAAIADISTEESKGWNMSLVSLTSTFALILGPVLGALFSLPYLVQKEGYVLPFAVSALLALVAFVWIYFSFEETYIPKKKQPPFNWLRPLYLFKEALLSKALRAWLLGMLLFQLGMGIYYVMISLELRQTYHYSGTLIGLFYAFMGIGFTLSLLFIYPHLLTRFSLKQLMVWGIGGMSFFIVLAGFLPNAWSHWVNVFFMALFDVVGWTAFLAAYSNIMPADKQGWGMGVIASCVAIAFMLSGFASNLLEILSPRTQMIIGGFLSLFAAVILHFASNKKLDLQSEGIST